MSVNFPRFIAQRYVRTGKRTHLVSFMSAISIAGLALGIAILITVLSVMNGFDREMRENILGIVPHITISSAEILSDASWDEVAEIARQHPDVLATAPVINTPAVLASPAGTKGVIVSGIDAELEHEVSAIARFMVQGSLEALQQVPWGIVLGESLAQRLQVEVGGRVDLFSLKPTITPITPLAKFKSFEVVGIFRVGTQELDNELVMINLPAARVLFRMRSAYNGLRLRTNDVLAADQIRFQLAGALPAGFTTQSWVAQLGSIYENIRFSRSIIGFMLCLLIGVAAFNLVVSLIMIVRDKRGDIAILRTLGASPVTINRVFMWQGCFIGILGISIGVVLGIIGSLQISKLAEFVESFFSIQLLSAEVYPIDFLPSQLRLQDVSMVAGGVFILSLLATIYPARRAAAIQPAEALRSE